MQELRVDNYVITTPIIKILRQLKLSLTNGKLKDIRDGSENIVVTCPHHGGGHERTPACNIYVGSDGKAEYGSYRCFVCGDEPGGSGSFVRFVQECFECSETYAKEWLLTKFDTEVCSGVRLGPPIDLESLQPKRFIGLDKKVLETYQPWHPYLGERGLSREICEFFQVRYDPQLRQIVFPCFNSKGDLLMMPRRSVDYKTFYLDKTMDKPVYCLDYVIKNNFKKVVITEGPFDCLKGNQFGVPTIATFGQISDSQIDEINKSCIQVIYTMFDNDQAGKRFTEHLKRKISRRIIVEEVQLPPSKKDLGDLTYEEFWNSLNKVM